MYRKYPAGFGMMAQSYILHEGIVLNQNQPSHTHHHMQVRMPRHVHSLSRRAVGQSNFMMKYGFSTKASGRKTTVFGKKFRKLIGRMSFWKRSSRMACERTSTGSFLLSKSMRSWGFLGRFDAFLWVTLIFDLYTTCCSVAWLCSVPQVNNH